MTTFATEAIQCACCGHESKHAVLLSTSRFGSSDLDTRPPEPMRSTMRAWVQRCPGCGYCATSIAIGAAQLSDIVKRKDYQQQLNNPAYPELADSFLCAAIILREHRDYANAAWATVRAAWTCDDSGGTAQARECRLEAAQILRLAQDRGQILTNPTELSVALQVDLLRRSGDFGQARMVLQEHRESIGDNAIARILDFQACLIDRQDRSCHLVAEAIPAED